MTQTGFEQLSKEMAVFAQNNHRDYKKLQEFYLYELELRCINKREFRDKMLEMTKEVEE